jgi:CsoR family transcriptional regulator, copper-sensing transcriptional repressor
MQNNKNSAQDCEHCKSETKHKSEIALVNRIAGQVNAVGRMIEEDRYCPDILNQVRAARSALKTLESRILETHLQSCVQEAFTSGNKPSQNEKIREIIGLFTRYDSAEK